MVGLDYNLSKGRFQNNKLIMSKLNTWDWIAIVLVIIGAINWGLVGLLGLDVVAAIFGVATTLSAIVYIIVGLAGLYMIYTATKMGNRTPAAM